MAMEMAAFDGLSEGRAVLGIGAGISSKVKRMQVPNDRPIAAVRDAMTITRRLARDTVAAMLTAYWSHGNAAPATRAAIAAASTRRPA